MLIKRLSIITGFTGPILFTIVMIYAGANHTGYSHFSQPISELGAAGAPSAVVFNYLGLMVFGASLILFVPAFLNTFVSGILLWSAAFLLQTVGIVLVALALYTCDQSCMLDMVSRHGEIHHWLALAVLPLMALVPGVIGLRKFQHVKPANYYSISLYTSLVILSVFLLLVFTGDDFFARGVLQRLGIAFFILWIFITAGQTWKRVVV